MQLHHIFFCFFVALVTFFWSYDHVFVPYQPTLFASRLPCHRRFMDLVPTVNGSGFHPQQTYSQGI